VKDWGPQAAVTIKHLSERLDEDKQEIIDLQEDIDDANRDNAGAEELLQLLTSLNERR
jgi:hypothetical protein